MRNFSFFQPTKPEPIAYPSALSTTLSHQLIHPIFTFSASIQKPSSYFTYFQGLKKTLPCDTHVVNLKILQQNIMQQASDTAALFLHRIGYDCRFRWRCSEKKVSSSMESSAVTSIFIRKPIIDKINFTVRGCFMRNGKE